jgi:hypothetical protein
VRRLDDRRAATSPTRSSYFKLHSVPPVSGFAIGIDTDNAKAPAMAKSCVKSISYF